MSQGIPESHWLEAHTLMPTLRKTKSLSWHPSEIHQGTVESIVNPIENMSSKSVKSSHLFSKTFKKTCSKS